MQHLFSYTILISIFFVLKFFIKDLKSKFYEKHQKLTGKESIPLFGGIIIFLYYSYEISFEDLNFVITSFLILLLGFFSDNNSLQSPKLRLFLQTIILTSFIYFSDLQINDLRNDLLNNLLLNYYFSIFFTTFCLLVLMNGSNFIDGLDGLNLGYFFLIIIIIFFIEKFNTIIVDKNQIMVIFYLISFLLFMNIKNFLYLGDSGSYLVGFIFGVLLIELNNYNYFLSPYFIALLLWYPAFENLFSIIRKRVIKKDPLRPDNLHFHQLLFSVLKKNQNRIIKKFSNIISSFLIILYNLCVFIVALSFLNHTKILLLILLFNVINYLFFYFIFEKKFFSKKNQ